MSFLEIRGVHKDYTKGVRKVPALRGVDLSIERGEFLCIVGPSGSGKTTLLNIIGCLDMPTKGSVIYDGVDLSGLNERELSRYRRDNISFIFQSFNLIPVLTVLENVELPLVIGKRHSREACTEKAMGVIRSVGLEDMADRRPNELSGGQEQRVAIARALVKEPLVVLADEATANLDSGTSEEIVSVMEEMNARLHTTFVFSTHDPLVVKHARRVATIRDGRLFSDERKQA